MAKLNTILPNGECALKECFEFTGRVDKESIKDMIHTYKLGMFNATPAQKIIDQQAIDVYLDLLNEAR